MQSAMRLARERGATTMELGTSVSDREARRLYEGLGFTNLEREGDPESRMLYYEREL
jgi:ribosomal protein S18 acetylase RimI-like enzyme